MLRWVWAEGGEEAEGAWRSLRKWVAISGPSLFEQPWPLLTIAGVVCLVVGVYSVAATGSVAGITSWSQQEAGGTAQHSSQATAGGSCQRGDWAVPECSWLRGSGCCCVEGECICVRKHEDLAGEGLAGEELGANQHEVRFVDRLCLLASVLIVGLVGWTMTAEEAIAMTK